MSGAWASTRKQRGRGVHAADQAQAASRPLETVRGVGYCFYGS